MNVLDTNFVEVTQQSTLTEEFTQEELAELFTTVELDETKSEHLSVEPYSYWKSVFRVFLKKPSAIIAITTFILLLIGCIVIPMFATQEAYDGIFANNNLGPSKEYLFGTDLIGRDLWYVCWKATGTSLIYALRATLINVGVGVVIGFIWGYFRKLDRIFIEIYNFIANVPSMLVYMLLSYVFVQKFPDLANDVRLTICLCLTGWLGMARFIRNQVIIITNREYNVASITLGTPARRIITRNLLPYILAVIVTETALIIPSMVSSEVALSYFGLGLPSKSISIGAVLNAGIEKFGVYNNQLLFPALMLGIIIFVFFLLGTALSDALDPKTHR